MDKFSFLSAMHTKMVDSMYEQYIKDPNSVDESWRRFFQGFDFAKEVYSEEEILSNTFSKEFNVINLINEYRKRGHLFTKTNPVRERRKYSPSLEIENFGLNEKDLDTVFQAGIEVGLGPSKLKDIVLHLKQVYCQSIGVEYMYIRESDEVDWIKNRLHQNNNTPNFTTNQKKHILKKLNQAVAFENFLHTKYVGQKRFSLEGAESLIPALDALIEKGADLGVKEYIMGMAHRGRLNVLANIFNKTYKDIFTEFEGFEYEDALFDGDVKYHLGFTSEQKCDNGKSVKLSLSPNPSHLEAVSPVVQGIARSKITSKYKGDNKNVIPILIHGDAALAGQGVVYEVTQMSQLEGYKTGGTIHVVINNQIGFTTNYIDARSSTYCTDVAKVTLSPVFHVNGDDVESVVHALQIATEYRQKFGKDVFIDLLCYRKYGHNEGDEPRFTQPLLYKAISKHKNPREIYNQQLMEEGVVEASIAKEMELEFKKLLQSRFDLSKEVEKASITPFMKNEWKSFIKATEKDFTFSPNTSVEKKALLEVSKYLYEVKDSDKLFKKTQRLLSDRQKNIQNGTLDWALCELLAYGTLLKEGHSIRISGQDVERGTFSHRHAILKLEESEKELSPLSNINPNAKFEIYNSLLSEYAVLGFDYGYAMANPQTLTIWEAQFGDFGNGAQIMIDQFLSSAEEKWKIMNGLVMLLPHGYEGQGAEHSSARMERYLQLCAQLNMQLVNCTTPANFFHVLRRQLKRKFRKPLIVFTPKSLLRHKSCISSINDLINGSFQEVIDDDFNVLNKDIKKLVLCSGKLYYELINYREKNKIKNVAIVRIEQLYPLPYKQIIEIIDKYKAKELIWAQEEPENMGSWSYIMRNMSKFQFQIISRSQSAATASGSSKRSAKRQQKIIENVFK